MALSSEDEMQPAVSGFSDEEDEDVIVAMAAAAAGHLLTKFELYDAEDEGRSGYGSVPGRKNYKKIYRRQGARRIDREWFCRQDENVGKRPCFDEEEFRSRYRVSREIYETVRECLLDWGSYFHERRDCTGLLGASTDQKLFAAMRMLTDGCSAEALKESSRLSGSPNLESRKEFCRGVVECFECDWLRLPNEEELKRIS